MELKYIEELNSIVDKLVRQFGCTAEVDTDFAYYHDDKVITWSPFIMEKADRYFHEYVDEEYPYIEADVFLWSIFHEIGHHMTYNKFTAERLVECRKEKDLLAEALEEADTGGSLERLCYRKYFTVDDEFMATAWAADYMESNADIVAEFWLNFVDEFDKFLSYNSVVKNSEETFSEKI